MNRYIPIEQLAAGTFWERVREWQEQQHWYRMPRTTEAEELARREQIGLAWTHYQAFVQALSEAAWAARKVAAENAAERLGIGSALADKLRRSTTPGSRPLGVNKALGWWQRSTKSLLVSAAGDADESLLAAAAVVWRGNGRLVHANELQRRQKEHAWFDAVLGARVLALAGLYAGEGEKTWIEASLHELLLTRSGAGLRTVLVSPLRKDELVAAVAPAVRDILTAPDTAWLWSAKEALMSKGAP
jgi:hypothetical protein